MNSVIEDILNVIPSILGGLLVGSLIIAGAAFVKSTSDNMPQNFSESTVQLGHFCSGTVIEDPTGKGKGTILTARHCVIDLITGKVEKEIIPITLKTYDKEGHTVAEDEVNFKVVQVSDKSDLALLQTDSGLFNLPTIPIYDGDLRTGDRVFAVGYPGGTVLTITDGFIGPVEKIRAFSPISTSQEFRRSTTLIAPGSSGGSLITQTTFRGPQLVGVATGVNLMFPFMTYWVPIEEIRTFIKEAKAPTFDEIMDANEI